MRARSPVHHPWDPRNGDIQAQQYAEKERERAWERERERVREREQDRAREFERERDREREREREQREREMAWEREREIEQERERERERERARQVSGDLNGVHPSRKGEQRTDVCLWAPRANTFHLLLSTDRRCTTSGTTGDNVNDNGQRKVHQEPPGRLDLC